MAELLTMSSLVELGCDNCDTCCRYRGDIRVTVKNIFEISKKMNISVSEFINEYTHEIGGLAPEKALNASGEFQRCVMYDKERNRCSINSVKPVQCVIFPLVPESLKHDYFYVKGKCKCVNKNFVTVDEWINGNNNIYNRNKKINIIWVQTMELIQYYWEYFDEEIKKQIYELLYLNYNFEKKNIDRQIFKNLKTVEKLVEKFYKKYTKALMD